MPAILEQNNRREHFSSLLIYIPLFIFLLLTFFIFYLNNSLFDTAISNTIAGYENSELTRLMITISFLGNHTFLIPFILFLIACFIIGKKYKTALMLLIVPVTSIGMVTLLKNLFQRHRPDSPLVEGITNFSFPSGHAFMSIAIYGLLIWLIAKKMNNVLLQKLITILLILLILAIGFSRIYLRVHYTTDVIAGFSIGFAWLIICLSVIKNVQLRIHNKSKE